MPMTALRAEQLPIWRAALTDFALSTRLPDVAAFHGRLDRFRSPRGISFSILESGPQWLVPMEGRIDDTFWLAMVLEGEATLRRKGETSLIATRDILYGRRGAEGSLDFHTPFRMAMANIPATMLTRASLVPLPDRIVHLPDRSGTVRVLGALLSATAESVDRLDDAGTFAIEAALVQLVVSALFDDTGLAPLGGLASVRASALQRVWQSIERKLQDHELSIAEIAAEHRLSVRYVQLLFEESGQTFRSYVRTRRLEKCRAALADPLNTNVSITEICLHWGFGDSATFSRAFRDAFDCTPSQHRAHAAGRQTTAGRLRGVAAPL